MWKQQEEHQKIKYSNNSVKSKNGRLWTVKRFKHRHKLKVEASYDDSSQKTERVPKFQGFHTWQPRDIAVNTKPSKQKSWRDDHPLLWTELKKLEVMSRIFCQCGVIKEKK